jgi:hypothetical protein
MDAIEWMELQAMKAGLRQRSEELIDRLLEKRRASIASVSSAVETVHLLDDFVADFTGLRDTTAESQRLKELSQRDDVKKALARERASDDAEMRTLMDIFDLEAGLNDRDRHNDAMIALRGRLSELAKRAAAPDESPQRSQARRVLRSITAGASGRVQDREYMQLLNELGMRGRGGV